MHFKFLCACNQSPRFSEASFQNIDKLPLPKRQRELSSQSIILKLVISGLKLHGFIMTVGRQTNERFPGIFRVTSRESMDEFH